jgi:hypothetical protein
MEVKGRNMSRKKKERKTERNEAKNVSTKKKEGKRGCRIRQK